MYDWSDPDMPSVNTSLTALRCCYTRKNHCLTIQKLQKKKKKTSLWYCSYWIKLSTTLPSWQNKIMQCRVLFCIFSDLFCLRWGEFVFMFVFNILSGLLLEYNKEQTSKKHDKLEVLYFCLLMVIIFSMFIRKTLSCSVCPKETLKA